MFEDFVGERNIWAPDEVFYFFDGVFSYDEDVVWLVEVVACRVFVVGDELSLEGSGFHGAEAYALLSALDDFQDAAALSYFFDDFLVGHMGFSQVFCNSFFIVLMGIFDNHQFVGNALRLKNFVHLDQFFCSIVSHANKKTSCLGRKEAVFLRSSANGVDNKL